MRLTKIKYRVIPKYRNQRVCVEGLTFDSKKEAIHYLALKARERLGEIRDVRRQVTHPLIVNGRKLSSYRCDFMYVDAQGQTVVEDAKGYQNPKDPVVRLYRLKVALLAATTGLQVREIT